MYFPTLCFCYAALYLFSLLLLHVPDQLFLIGEYSNKSFDIIWIAHYMALCLEILRVIYGTEYSIKIEMMIILFISKTNTLNM